jgi:hypothetical protein
MNIRKRGRRLLVLAAVIASGGAAGAEASTVPDPQDLRAANKIAFSISGATAVRPQFERWEPEERLRAER